MTSVVLSWRGRGPLVAALLLAGCAGMSACVRPNPGFDTNGTDSGSGGDTLAVSVTDAGSTTGPGPTVTGSEGTTGSEGATGTSSQSTGTTGPAPATCGDGTVDPGEGCDDGNTADDDGCLSCVVPMTCAEILALAPASPSGTYLVDPGSSGVPWPVTCDMEMAGGGWTGFMVQDTCNGHLDSKVVGLTAAPTAGIDADCRPYTEYGMNGGEYLYYFDIAFPPGFGAFFLRDYEVQGLGDVELKYEQVLWAKGSEFPNGALSLGDAHDEGPVANWAKDGGIIDPFVDGQILPYPLQEVPFELGQSADRLRIGWGEIGIGNEDLYPWWSGQIFVR